MDNDIYKLILESNAINFCIFVFILYLIQKKYLKKAKADKNEQIASQLNQAKQRYKKAEEELKKSQNELNNFKDNLGVMQNEQEELLDKLKNSIEEENAQKIKRIEQKHKQEMQRLMELTKNKIKAEIVKNLVIQTKENIRNDTNKAKELHQTSFNKF